MKWSRWTSLKHFCKSVRRDSKRYLNHCEAKELDFIRDRLFYLTLHDDRAIQFIFGGAVDKKRDEKLCVDYYVTGQQVESS